jgi:hypothetical protein
MGRLCEALAPYRGHPALRTVLTEMGEDALPLLEPKDAHVLGGNEFAPGVVDRVLAKRAELKALAGRYGLPIAGNPFVLRSAPLLMRFGRWDDVLSFHDPRERVCAQALLQSGRYDELLARFPDDPLMVDDAMLAQGRLREVLARPESSRRARAQALYELGDFATLERDYPDSDTFDSLLLNQGRFAEFEARHPPSESPPDHPRPYQTPRYRLLAAQQRWEEILHDYTNPATRSEALCELGRTDEASALLPNYRRMAEAAAIGWLSKGERIDEALDKIACCARGDPPIPASIQELFERELLPALVPALVSPRDPAPLLADMLARDRYAYAQLRWYLAAFIAGRIDEDEFRRQPTRRFLDEALLLGKALRADCRGERQAALAAWTAFDALPSYRRSLYGSVREVVKWRKDALSRN